MERGIELFPDINDHSDDDDVVAMGDEIVLDDDDADNMCDVIDVTFDICDVIDVTFDICDVIDVTFVVISPSCIVHEDEVGLVLARGDDRQD